MRISSSHDAVDGVGIFKLCFFKLPNMQMMYSCEQNKIQKHHHHHDAYTTYRKRQQEAKKRKKNNKTTRFVVVFYHPWLLMLDGYMCVLLTGGRRRRLWPFRHASSRGKRKKEREGSVEDRLAFCSDIMKDDGLVFHTWSIHNSSVIVGILKLNRMAKELFNIKVYECGKTLQIFQKYYKNWV